MIGDWIARTFYGADELQAESDRLDARRQELNAAAREKYGDEWYQDTLNNDAAGAVNAAESIGAEFTPEALAGNLEDSAGTAAGWFRRVLGAPLSFLFGSVPLLGWLILAGVVFWWLGGPAWARGALARAKA